MYAISAKNVTRKFGDFVAVDNVDLVVKENTIFGLLGPNGAGKSTLIQMMVGMIRTTSGSIEILGKDINKDTEKVQNDIGVALQDIGLDPNMTGRELLTMQARMFDFSATDAAKKADELLAMVRLTDAGDKLIKAYSGGMKRRLDLASALVHTPKVLFLDEPTTGLDPSSRAIIWGEIEKLHKQGVTILVTTQYLEEADKLCDRIAIIDKGKVIIEDTPENLKAKIGSDIVDITFADGTNLDTLAGKFATYGTVTKKEKSLHVAMQGSSARLTDMITDITSAGLKPETLNVTKPTLDDVFLQLVQKE